MPAQNSCLVCEFYAGDGKACGVPDGSCPYTREVERGNRACECGSYYEVHTLDSQGLVHAYCDDCGVEKWHEVQDGE